MTGRALLSFIITLKIFACGRTRQAILRWVPEWAAYVWIRLCTHYAVGPSKPAQQEKYKLGADSGSVTCGLPEVQDESGHVFFKRQELIIGAAFRTCIVCTCTVFDRLLPSYGYKPIALPYCFCTPVSLVSLWIQATLHAKQRCRLSGETVAASVFAWPDGSVD